MTRTIGNFVPERLEQALAARGFSAIELAARIGATSTTISRWRNCVQVPSGEMIDRLASELRVSPEWLTRPLQEQISIPYFRGSISQMKADRALLNARAGWLDEVSRQLEMYVDYPDLDIPVKNYKKLSEITDTDIEDAAEECRERWGLKNGPIADVLLLLENAGVIVAREETGTPRIEGLSAWSANGRPIVLLCADKGNAYRSRFDAAHELGHLVLHRYIEDPADAAAHKQIEQQAHRFAGAFLLPSRGFAAEVTSPVSLQGLLFLKRRWGVSVAAMIMRLVALGVIGDSDYLRLIKLRSAKWGNKREPNDDDRDPEQPRLLKRTVDLLSNEGIVTADALPSMLGLSARDVESLLGLPFGLLGLPKADVLELKLKTDLKHMSPDEQVVSGTYSEQTLSNVIDLGAARKS
ncbi:XRE family transcriptional regulator [uncultured Propionivibrio sp.]|uniref:helix-turn-helix domain-containing protein n=1 Tax=uncultured Propionivibrio sp. TaxID=426737 RepID=UPI0029BFAF3F|nr:XRE family transcriptional regulator [uncultured Propionivibrio sp.]